MSRFRIAVPRREIFEDLPAKHYPSDASERRARRCGVFRDSQTFDTNPPCERPDGFCLRAWAGIQRDVASVSLGVGHPWADPHPMAGSCCTDGFRPAVFRTEHVFDTFDERGGEG